MGEIATSALAAAAIESWRSVRARHATPVTPILRRSIRPSSRRGHTCPWDERPIAWFFVWSDLVSQITIQGDHSGGEIVRRVRGEGT
jgi:hypothetical protein